MTLSRENALRKALDEQEAINADLLAALKGIRRRLAPLRVKVWGQHPRLDAVADAYETADAAITNAEGES